MADAHEDTLTAYEADGLGVTRDGNLWTLSGDVRNTRRLAARGLTDLNEPEGTVVVASNGSHTTIMLRNGPMLITVDSTSALWRFYTIRPPRTPMSMLGGGEAAPREDRHAPLRPVPDEVVGLTEALGVDAAELAATIRAPKPPPRRDRSWDW
jgi:hypothetical protein